MTKKIILIVLGIVLMLCGLGAIVPGAILTGVTGADNTIDSGYHTISTPTPALVSETERVKAGSMRSSGLGSTSLKISARDSAQPIFLGVARASDVEQFLQGVAYDEVRELNVRPFRMETRRHDGNDFAFPPGDETFWVASDSGDSPTLEWTVESGDYRIVMMNTDGSPGTSAQAEFGVKVEGLRGIGIGTIIGGGLIFLVGLGLLLWGIFTKRRPQPATVTGPMGGSPTTGGYPAPTPPPATPPEAPTTPRSPPQPPPPPPQPPTPPPQR
jgi:hypothetical protein